ncbi:HNH endonuclease [Pararhodobacter sp.]|uniref:HNH endonuclease n=1 Tax=Pararhodobacter sp. TaxID=2127056 RepID=UPI002AFFFA71|nr:HNH endonuclease [Pararhodobacter sp.]
MASKPKLFRPGHARDRTEQNREYDARRGSARSRGYTSAWDKAARAYLAAHPLCAYCGLVDQVAAAECVDHLYPQRVYPETFWRSEWWVPSCHACHNGYKQGVERKGLAALDALAVRLGRPVRPR